MLLQQHIVPIASWFVSYSNLKKKSDEYVSNSIKRTGLCLHCMFAPSQLLLFLKGFTESERNKLAMLTGILLANGNISASILSSLFNENLVKEGTYFSACRHAELLCLLFQEYGKQANES